MSSNGSPQARIWTTAIKLSSEYFNWDKSVCGFDRETIFKQKLGEHYEKDVSNVENLVIDPVKYIKFINDLLLKLDEKVLVYGIVHDKDVKKQLNEIIPVEKHLHVLLRFSSPVRLNAVAERLGVLPSLIEKQKVKGRFAFSSSMAYLIHALSPEKYQYSAENVISGINSPSYLEFYEEEKKNWVNRVSKIRSQKRQESFSRVLEQVMTGVYTREDLLTGDDELYMLYVKNKRAFDDAREAYLERKFIQYNKDVDSGKIKIQTLFISGEAGLGKTKLAKTVAEGVCHASSNKWRVFQAASSNPFDNYDGQEILLLDDFRATSLKSASDWLKLLDAHNNSQTSARYRNASVMPRLILITATETPHEFFSYVKSADNEALDQFLRRIEWSAKVVGINDSVDISLGKLYKLDKPKSVDLIPEELRSYTKKNDRFGGSVRSFNFKAAKKKSFHYVYEDVVTSSFEKIKNSLISYYASYFGFKSLNDVSLIDSDTLQSTNKFLPIVHDDPFESVEDLDK